MLEIFLRKRQMSVIKLVRHIFYINTLGQIDNREGVANTISWLSKQVACHVWIFSEKYVLKN